jgi:tetratricopeptide (TPR) repeat protein
VRKWYDTLESNNIKPDGIFWWGFYRNAYLEQFLNALLRFVSQGQIEPETIKSTWEKTERIKEYIHQGTYLIILDGLEQMQKSASGDEFGKMIYRECTELLHYLADVPKADGLCLITTRYPLKDLDEWHERSYKNLPLIELSIPDSLLMLRSRGVKGSDEDLTEVIKRYKGHALSLTSVAGYLKRYYDGDIKQAPEVEFILGDKARFKDVNKLLRKYAEKMSEPERIFLHIFSLFRQEITENDFAGVFRHEIEDTKFNDVLVKMSELDFRDLIDGLVDWRLISYDETKKSYTTHPLIKGYFESNFDERNKELCHKRIYQYFGEYAPKQPETLEEMQTVFEQIYHGCPAEMYQEAFDDYWEKVQRKEQYFLIYKLGAWETCLNIIKNFFEQDNFQTDPLISNSRNKAELLCTVGLSMKMLGRLKEPEGLYRRAIKLNISQKDWRNASIDYLNMALLQMLTGQLKERKENIRKAIQLTRKANETVYECYSIAYFAHTLFLMGETKKAILEFEKANEIQRRCDPSVKYLYSIRGIFYADFLLASGKIEKALEVTEDNLKISERNNFINDVNLCYRSFASIFHHFQDLEKAEKYAVTAISCARRIGKLDIEVEALLELARIRFNQGVYKEVKENIDTVSMICDRCGFKLYEPEAEIVLSKAYLALNDIEQAKNFAHSAYEKAIAMWKGSIHR